MLILVLLHTLDIYINIIAISRRFILLLYINRRFTKPYLSFLFVAVSGSHQQRLPLIPGTVHTINITITTINI